MERLHALLLAELRAAGELEWSRAVADSSHVQAKGAPRRARARLTEPETDRSTISWSTRNGGSLLAWTVTGGNRHDVTQLIPLVDALAGARPQRPAPPPPRTGQR